MARRTWNSKLGISRTHEPSNQVTGRGGSIVLVGLVGLGILGRCRWPSIGLIGGGRRRFRNSMNLHHRVCSGGAEEDGYVEDVGMI